MIQVTQVGIKQFDDRMKTLPGITAKAASMSINTGAKKARTWSQREILGQVNFKAAYLRENLEVTRTASRNDLTAVITGRKRPTTLTRFVTNPRARKGKVKVRVKKGSAPKTLKGAFLRTGNSGNKLLIQRTAGSKPEASYKPRRFGPSGKLWVMYGPSVDQVFRTVKDDIAPKIESFVGSEFKRNFRRLSGQ